MSRFAFACTFLFAFSASAEKGAVAVLDRSVSYGLQGGPVFHEIRSFARGDSPQMINYVYGLGGRDIYPRDIEGIFHALAEIKQSGGPGDVYRSQLFMGIAQMMIRTRPSES